MKTQLYKAKASVKSVESKLHRKVQAAGQAIQSIGKSVEDAGARWEAKANEVSSYFKNLEAKAIEEALERRRLKAEQKQMAKDAMTNIECFLRQMGDALGGAADMATPGHQEPIIDV